MSRYVWVVFLAAIFVLTRAGISESRNSSPHVGDARKAHPEPTWLAKGLNIRDSNTAEGLPQTVSATTNNTISIKLSDLPVGKVIQVGELKFVKVGGDQYLSISAGCVDPVLTTTGAQKLLTYTGNYQSHTFYAGCEYQIELWGAQGGSMTKGVGGYGAYAKGNIEFITSTELYFYLGEQKSNSQTAAFNAGSTAGSGEGGQAGGGGGSDLRVTNGSWNNASSLRSRIMVAAGGGGGSDYRNRNSVNGKGGNGGGLTGYDGVVINGSNGAIDSSYTVAKGGTQISGGTTNGDTGYCSSSQPTAGQFGIGGNGNACYGGGGGGGWYGGGGAGVWTWRVGSGPGGSSYISGHTGCVAVTSTSDSSPKSGCTTGTTDNSCSISPYGYTFTNTVMIDGAGYQWTNVKGALKQMPNPTGGNYASGVGHTGNGYARITRLN